MPGGLDIEKLIKPPMIYSVSYFDLGVLDCSPNRCSDCCMSAHAVDIKTFATQLFRQQSLPVAFLVF